MASRLVHPIETALSQAAGSLTSKTFSVSVRDQAAVPAPPENAIVWQQSFSITDGPSFRIVAGRDLWEALGRLTLESAGLEAVTLDHFVPNVLGHVVRPLEALASSSSV